MDKVDTPLPPDGCCVRLSERDAEQVLRDAENPPAPNEAALEAARRYSQWQPRLG